jgi:hypothetical protein
MGITGNIFQPVHQPGSDIHIFHSNLSEIDDFQIKYTTYQRIPGFQSAPDSCRFFSTDQFHDKPVFSGAL